MTVVKFGRKQTGVKKMSTAEAARLALTSKILTRVMRRRVPW